MGSSPNLYYLGHPVLLTGAEVENTAATLTVDTATSIPFVAIGFVPAVNDYVNICAVNGRWASDQGSTTPANPSCLWVCPLETCTFSSPGGGGTRATGVVVMSGNTVSGVIMTGAGSGYNSIATVTFSAPPAGGTTATGTCMMGPLASITVTNGGAGYAVAPTITIGAPQTGGTQATAIATVAGGAVTGISLTNPGVGYNGTVPTVTIAGGGVGATATASAAGTVDSVIMTNAGSGYNNPEPPPTSITVTDPIYGTFVLPRVADLTGIGIPTCRYQLFTTLPYGGNAQCPSGPVPVCMQLENNIFSVSIGVTPITPTTTDTCTLPILPSVIYCPTDFPTPSCTGINPGAGIQPVVAVQVSCLGSRPWSYTGLSGLIQSGIGLVAGASAPPFLLYGGGCPRTSFTLTWTLSE